MRVYSLFVVLLTAACSSHAPVATAAQPKSAAAAAGRKDIHWFRSSAEYRGIALEVYRTAADRVTELARGRSNGSWAVILDADETVLDNSLHERELADRNEVYTEAGWTTWVRRRAATAIPGAVEFIKRVHSLGGRIAIVTNRADSLCTPTRENLKNLGVDADVVLCKVTASTDKNSRFQQVQSGNAAPGIPALVVLAWIGDNIQDFPNLTQAVRTVNGGYADFGVRFFLLPNPMYGSWEKNPEP